MDVSAYKETRAMRQGQNKRHANTRWRTRGQPKYDAQTSNHPTQPRQPLPYLRRLEDGWVCIGLRWSAWIDTYEANSSQLT